MEIHPRTVAAAYRDRAHDYEGVAHTFPLGSQERYHHLGVAEGLRLAAQDLDQRADAEFDRIMAEHQARGGRTSVTVVKAAEAARRAGVGRSS